MVYGSNATTAGEPAPAGRSHEDIGRRQSADRQRHVRGRRSARRGESRRSRRCRRCSCASTIIRSTSCTEEHPNWSGDQLYDHARAIVTAEIANITYSEFLPNLLGADALSPYHGYKPGVDPHITLEFAGAAFRFGHSIVSDETENLAENGEVIGGSERRPAGRVLPAAGQFHRPTAARTGNCAISPPTRRRRSTPASSRTCAIFWSIRRPSWISPRSTSSARAISASARSTRRARRSGSIPTPTSPRSPTTPKRSRGCRPPTATSTTSACGPAACRKITRRARWSARRS